MSNKEHIEQLRNELTSFKESQKRGKNRFFRLTILAFVICSCIITIAFSRSKKEITEKYESYVYGLDQTLTLDLLQYKDIYKHYETRSNGNSNSNLMTGGYFYAGDGISISPNADLTDTLITHDGEIESICGELCSYINVFDDAVYYRKNSDRHVYRKPLDGMDVTLVLESNVGQFLISDWQAYYIDLGDGNALKTFDLRTPDLSTTLFSSVASFAVFQNYVFILAMNNELYLLDINAQGSLIYRDIERFFFNGSLIVQNNQNILILNLEGEQLCQVAIPGIDTLELVYVHGERIVFRNSNSLYSYDQVTKETKMLLQGYDLYTSVSFDDTSIQIVSVTIDKENGSTVHCVILGQ